MTPNVQAARAIGMGRRLLADIAFDDVELVIRATLDGIGVAFMSEDRVTDHLASRALVRVLED
jgi:DNA-binding transcriptional LysR family regulator